KPSYWASTHRKDPDGHRRPSALARPGRVCRRRCAACPALAYSATARRVARQEALPKQIPARLGGVRCAFGKDASTDDRPDYTSAQPERRASLTYGVMMAVT